MIYDDNAALYDLQYAAYRDDIPFYTRLAHDQGGSVLELGAGTGRVTEALLAAGHEVVAVDASAAMLARAATRLAGREGVELVEADMRSVRLGRHFDLVIAPFNTLMHAYTLDDQDRTMEVVAAHLDNAGVFAFDLYVPRFGPLCVVRREPELGTRAPTGDALREDVFLVQTVDALAQLVTTTYLHDAVAADGTVRRRVSELTQRYYTRFEVERLCRAAGFRLDVYGGFDRSRYSEASPLMVCLARPDRRA